MPDTNSINSNNLKNKQLFSNFVRWNFGSYWANPPPYRNRCFSRGNHPVYDHCHKTNFHDLSSLCSLILILGVIGEVLHVYFHISMSSWIYAKIKLLRIKGVLQWWQNNESTGDNKRVPIDATQNKALKDATQNTVRLSLSIFTHTLITESGSWGQRSRSILHYQRHFQSFYLSQTGKELPCLWKPCYHMSSHYTYTMRCYNAISYCIFKYIVNHMMYTESMHSYVLYFTFIKCYILYTTCTFVRSLRIIKTSCHSDLNHKCLCNQSDKQFVNKLRRTM